MMTTVMNYPARVFPALILLAAPLLRADFLLPPGVEDVTIGVAVQAEVEVATENIAQQVRTSTDSISAEFADENFFQPLDAAVALDGNASAMGGEATLSRMADTRIVEYVLAGSFRPKTQVELTPGISVYAEASGAINVSSTFTLTKPALLTVELFLVGDQHYGSVSYTMHNLTHGESYSLQRVDGEDARTFVSSLTPGQVSLSLNLDSEGFSWFSGLSMAPYFDQAGGDLEYLIRITLDPDEDFIAPMPTLSIGPAANGFYRLDLDNLQPGYRYRLQRSPDLTADSWASVDTFTAYIEQDIVFESIPPGWDRVFYRLVMLKP